jgi:hypothetical protein
MLPTPKDIVAHAKASFVAQRDFAAQRFGIDLSDCQLILKNSLAQRQALGGYKSIRGAFRPFIQINVNCLLNYPVLGFIEYKSFHHNSVIGGFATADWRMWVDAVVAHEMAHVVQFTLPRQSPATTYEGLGKYEGSHGSFFQAIYRIMRVQFVNSRVTGVGRLYDRKEFQRTEEQVHAIVARKRTNNFEFEGRTVRLGALAVTLTEYDLKARKYQYIGVTASGKRYKLTRMQVLMGLQSEGETKLAA